MSTFWKIVGTAAVAYGAYHLAKKLAEKPSDDHKLPPEMAKPRLTLDDLAKIECLGTSVLHSDIMILDGKRYRSSSQEASQFEYRMAWIIRESTRSNFVGECSIWSYHEHMALMINDLAARQIVKVAWIKPAIPTALTKSDIRSRIASDLRQLGYSISGSLSNHIGNAINSMS